MSTIGKYALWEDSGHTNRGLGVPKSHDDGLPSEY